jgi:hypothetical protein
MTRLNWRFLLCILVVLATSSVWTFAQAKSDATTASSNTFRTGGLSLSIPSPGDDLVETGPDYRVVLEPLAPESNRLVAAFVQPDVLDALHAGNKPALKEYALIEVLLRAEFVDIDEESFKQIVDGVSQQVAAGLSGSMKESQAEVDLRLKALGSKDMITIDKPLPLGALFSKPGASGFGMVLPLTTKNGNVQFAMAMSVIRVRNRVLFGYFYTPYKDASTVSQLRTTDEQWTDAILKANQ